MRFLRQWPSTVLLLAGSVALACTSVLEDPIDRPVTRVQVAPDSVDLPIGTASVLHAFPLDSTGAFRPASEVVWASADPAIATVNDTGGISGVAAGVVTISATAGGNIGTARVRVGPAPRIALAVDSVTFRAEAGQGSPPPQTVVVTNGGGLSLSGLTVGAINFGDGPGGWLVAALDTTAAPATLTLQALTGTITQAGSYLAKVPLIANGAANSPESLAVVLEMVPGPPATYQMAIAAGNNQMALAGSDLPTRPEVTITDGFGNPIAGLPVTFLVVAGGGSIAGPAVNTDANGRAAVGAWTVQATGSVPADGKYVNQLQASAPSAGAVTFVALAYFNYTAHVHPLWALHGCAGCHGGANLGGLQLNQAPAATWTSELFDVPTLCGAGAFRQVARGGGIAAENGSILILKMDNVAPAVCPTPMPTNGVLIPAAARDTIRAWIRAGAPLDLLP